MSTLLAVAQHPNRLASCVAVVVLIVFTVGGSGLAAVAAERRAR